MSGTGDSGHDSGHGRIDAIDPESPSATPSLL
jgi:hypothetical protein